MALTRSITNALRVIRRGQRWVRCMKTKLRFSCEDDFTAVIPVESVMLERESDAEPEEPETPEEDENSEEFDSSGKEY